jgi:S1-C subfamily serine protease
MIRLAAILRGVAVCGLMSAVNLASAAEVPEAVLKAQQQRVDAIANAKRAAISIFARGGRGGGSGVVITPDGYALTNFHVAKPAGKHMQCSMPDGKLYDAVIVSYDPTGDVALIKMLGRDDFPVAEMANSNDVRVGDWCFAVGNPFLLATDFQPTVTWGIVSGIHRYQYPAGTLLEYTDCIQTDAAINPGNSGGPLFNSKGQLIGINGRGSFEKRGRVNVGVGYAISINQIKHFMGYLRSGRIVDHATLDTQVTTSEDGTVSVSNINELSDAYRRGLRYGDEIVSFGGRPIGTANEFLNVQGIFPQGWRVPLSYRHEGKRHDVMVRLRGRHHAEELIKKVERPAKAKPIKRPKKPGEKPERAPTPKDGDKPKGDKKEVPGNSPPKKIPVPMPHGMPAAKPMPPHVAKFYKARSGYANYYFNELNRDRVWKAFVKHGDFKLSTGNWELSGKLDDDSPIEINLGNKKTTAKIDGVDLTVDMTVDLDSQLVPRGSGGLLAALHLWRRFLTLGPAKFGDVYYLGTVPMVGGDDDEQAYLKAVVDVLVGTHAVVECRFQFDPEDGRLLGMEYFSSDDDDPCEILFDEYKDIGGRQVPHRLRVFRGAGDDIYGIIHLEKFTLPTSGKKES